MIRSRSTEKSDILSAVKEVVDNHPILLDMIKARISADDAAPKSAAGTVGDFFETFRKFADTERLIA